jgi:hypothetical protein
MPAGQGNAKSKRRSLNVSSAIKKLIVVVKAAYLRLDYSLIIVMAQANVDPKHISYRDAYLLDHPVEELLKASGVDLSNYGGLEDIQLFNINFRTTKILFNAD